MRLIHIANDNTKYVYNESFWTGKKTLDVNGEPATKIGKKTFTVGTEKQKEEIQVKGNFITGVTLQLSFGKKEVLCKNKWYEWILIIMPCLGLGLGIFGGAVGGGLSALFGFLGALINATILRADLRLYIKIPVCILIAATIDSRMVFTVFINSRWNCLGISKFVYLEQTVKAIST